jgi:hypothetical protein
MKAAASRRTPHGLCRTLKTREKKKPGGREISPGFLIEAKVLTRNLLLLLLLLLLRLLFRHIRFGRVRR